MSINSELADLNRTGNGLIGDLRDAGVSTGFQGGSHGVSFDVDQTNSLGRIDASSDPFTTRINDVQDFSSSRSDVADFTGSIGRLNATSDALDEENVNDADAGKPE